MTQLKFNPFTHKLDYAGLSGTGGGGISMLTGNTGPAVGPDPGGNVNIVGGSNVTVTGNALTNTLTISVAATFFTWIKTGTPQNLQPFFGYFSLSLAGALQLTLPLTAAIGDTYQVVDYNGQGWKILQNAGQVIKYRTSITTVGITGSIASQQKGDEITLVCSTPNLEWFVVDTIATLSVV